MVKGMVGSISSFLNVLRVVDDNSNPYRSMMINAIRMNQGYLGECSSVDELNENTTSFFLLFKNSK
jgi:hypothetical protein